MRARRTALPVLARLTISLALTSAIGAAVGCDTTVGLRDVPDSTGLFHFKVPEDWQFAVEPGVTSVYADEEFPTDGEQPQALAVVAFVSSTTTETPVPEALVAYAEYWGDSRGWQETEIGEPFDTSVGGRAASRVEISGADSSGRAFRAAYLWVRTNSREVLITAITPRDRWDAYADELDRLLSDDWYWHRPEGSSADETATP